MGLNRKTCFRFIGYIHGNVEFPFVADARATCLSRGGDLVSIVSMTEKNWLNNRLRALSGWAYSFWLGLNDRDFPLQWYWSDGSPYKLTAWDAGYPTNTPQSKYYLSLNAIIRLPGLCEGWMPGASKDFHFGQSAPG